MESVLLDVAGRRRSPATMPGYHRGRPPRNKGEPTRPTRRRSRRSSRSCARSVTAPTAIGCAALIVVLWRAGLRISEALSLQESDLDGARGAVLVRHGQGRRRREVGMDRWAWAQLDRGSRSAGSCRSARCSA